MKIAILGTENSHCMAFAKLIKNDPEYADIELVGVYGYDAEANKKILDAGLTACAAEKPEDFLGKVDAIMVTARHGDLHYEYALPYVKAGLPAFIDKPFTVDLEKGRALIDTAEKSGALICGGSSLKFLKELDPVRAIVKEGVVKGGYASAPVNMINEYGGFYFYSQHLIEMMTSVFGGDIKAVHANLVDEASNRLVVTFQYDGFDVVGQYYNGYTYSVAAVTDKAAAFASCADVSYLYKTELTEFAEMVRESRLPRPRCELLKPVIIEHAIEESYKTGKTVAVTL